MDQNTPLTKPNKVKKVKNNDVDNAPSEETKEDIQLNETINVKPKQKRTMTEAKKQQWEKCYAAKMEKAKLNQERNKQEAYKKLLSEVELIELELIKNKKNKETVKEVIPDDKSNESDNNDVIIIKKKQKPIGYAQSRPLSWKT